MQPVDTLICARWVLPIEPDGVLLEHHALAVRDGRIEAVLPTSLAVTRYAAAQRVDRPRHLLLPGLVNAHVRGAVTTAVATPDSADPEYARARVERLVHESLRSGTTCIGGALAHADVMARSVADHHLRMSVALVIDGGPEPWAASAGEAIEQGMRLRDEYQGDPLVSAHFSVPSPMSLDDDTLLRVRRLSDELELPVAAVLHASLAEIEHSQASTGLRPLQRLERLGLATPMLKAVHMNYCTAPDIEILAGAGAAVVHCAESGARRGVESCPMEALLARGIPLALGTDGVGPVNDLDLIGELRSAALLASSRAGSPLRLTATALLRLATLRGAQALGLGEHTGSLVAGKWADVCCIDLPASGCWSDDDPLEAVLYASARRAVSDVWVAGRHLFNEGYSSHG